MEEPYVAAHQYAAAEARSCRDVDLVELCDSMDLSGRHHMHGPSPAESARLPVPRRSPDEDPDPWGSAVLALTRPDESVEDHEPDPF